MTSPHRRRRQRIAKQALDLGPRLPSANLPEPEAEVGTEPVMVSHFARQCGATERARVEARLKAAHLAAKGAEQELKSARAEFEQHWPKGSHPWWDPYEEREPLDEEIAKLDGGRLPEACYETCLRMVLVDAAVKSGQLARAVAERCFRKVQRWALRVR